jgi:phosphoribosylformimino-5-aminoimidazole carboxamide ribotide isomerase
MNIIPAIDLHNGSCVRLYQGDFAQATTYSDDPAELARRFAGFGFSQLHVVDLDGAREGSQRNQDCVHAISRASDMSIQLGGGIRERATLERWFAAGVARCVLGSVAVTDPDRVKEWLDEFSSEQIVLALDVRIDDNGLPLLATHGWVQTSDLSLWDCLDDYAGYGLRHVLCTDVGRDGALCGPNLELYRELVERYPAISLQASGGVRNIEDLALAAQTGAAGAITGRALLDGRISPQEIASFQQNA